MIKAVDVMKTPCPTKEPTIRQVAVLLCTRLVTPSPANAAVKRLLNPWEK